MSMMTPSLRLVQPCTHHYPLVGAQEFSLDDLDGPDEFVVSPLPSIDPAPRGLRLDLSDRLLLMEADAIRDEYRPTLGPDFEPTVEDEAEWATLLFDEENRAYGAFIDGLAREREEAAFGSGQLTEADLFPVGYCS